MLTLYHHGSSVCAAKVRLVLHEKGLDWKGEYVDILRGEQFNPDYLKLNPNAVVPTLIHDGQIVIESTVICEFLDDIAPAVPLKPNDPYERAQMRIWTKRVDERLHPMTSVLTYVASYRHTILENNSPDQVETIINLTIDPVKRQRKREWIEHGLEAPTAKPAVMEFKKTLGDMDAALSKTPWLAGETYSLADIALAPYVNRLSMLGMDPFWQSYPRVADWFSRLRFRDSFEPALLSWVPEPLAESMRRHGKKSWPRVKELLAAE